MYCIILFYESILNIIYFPIKMSWIHAVPISVFTLRLLHFTLYYTRVETMNFIDNIVGTDNNSFVILFLYDCMQSKQPQQSSRVDTTDGLFTVFENRELYRNPFTLHWSKSYFYDCAYIKACSIFDWKFSQFVS